MANRTLRRNASGNDSTADTNADTNGSVARSEPELTIRESDPDSESDGNGSNNEPNSDRSSGIGAVEIDPEQLGEFIASGTNDSSDGTRKRRGRKPGVKYGPRKSKAQETIEPFLMMAHNWAAVLLKTPEIALAQEEAKQLSDAYTAFCQYHNVPILSAKRMSEINMIAALALVYGPRMIAVKNRVKQTREENKVKQARNVTEFGGPFHANAPN